MKKKNKVIRLCDALEVTHSGTIVAMQHPPIDGKCATIEFAGHDGLYVRDDISRTLYNGALNCPVTCTFPKTVNGKNFVIYVTDVTPLYERRSR